MADRFRDLERPRNGRVKDAVLMATVSSFEGLRQPRASDLRQFSELFEPLFSSSTDEARRQAAAALARCPHVPAVIASQIASAPIGIAALFLTRAVAIDDAVLIKVIRSQGAAHASAIARRDNLSVRVVDALVERRQSGPEPRLPDPRSTASKMASPNDADAALQREEALRRELKALARLALPPQAGRAAEAMPTLEPLDETHTALLVRFARAGEVNLFAATLSHALACSASFGERLVLDISGWQLAVSLTALGAARQDVMAILCALYPYLAERLGGGTRCDALVDGIDPADARIRVQSWIAADSRRIHGPSATHQPHLGPERTEDPRQPANQAQRPVVSSFYRRTLNRAGR